MAGLKVDVDTVARPATGCGATRGREPAARRDGSFMLTAGGKAAAVSALAY